MTRYGVRAKEIMIRNPVTLSANMTAYAGLHRLIRKSVGSAPVVDKENNLVGIITEGNFLEKIIIQKKNSNKTKIRDIMTKKIITANEDTDIGVLIQLMNKNKIRRLPIVDGRKLVGLITQNSLQTVTPGLMDVMIEKLKILKPGFKLRR